MSVDPGTLPRFQFLVSFHAELSFPIHVIVQPERPEYVYLSALVVLDVPAGVVTVTSTLPVEPVGAIAVISELLSIANDVAVLLPKLTFVAPSNSSPFIVTAVPPVVGPLVGVIEETVGGVAVFEYVKTLAEEVVDFPPAVVTVTFTTPLPAGLVAVIAETL